MPKVKVNGITMNYDQQGTGEPLILIPYLAADHACYAFQVAEYAKHFTCISLDLRGTGETDKPEGVYSTEVLADDVAAFMQADRRFPGNGQSVGERSSNGHSGNLPLVPYARAVCHKAGLYSIIGRFCYEPASAASRSFHPAVECRNSP